MSNKHKVLLFISVGAGDTINMTGVISALKKEYQSLQIDVLVKQEHLYLLESHPDIHKLFTFESLNLPTKSIVPNWVSDMTAKFVKEYDKVICMWCIAYYSVLKKDDRDMDYISLKMLNLEFNGLPLVTPRDKCSAFLTISKEDKVLVDNFAAEIPKGSPIVLFGEQVYRKTFPKFADKLRELGYLTAGNGPYNDISTKQLNLLQIKYFFDKYCTGFISNCRGITCSLYAEPVSLLDKKVIIRGLRPSWNFSKFFPCQPQQYLYTLQDITIEDVQKMFGG